MDAKTDFMLKTFFILFLEYAVTIHIYRLLKVSLMLIIKLLAIENVN